VKTGSLFTGAGNGKAAGTHSAPGEADRVCGKKFARPRDAGVRCQSRRQCNAALRLRQSIGTMASHFGINL